MDKTMNLVLKDEDLIELMRILLDEDAEGALTFLQQKHSLDECLPLGQDPAFSDRKETLEAML